MKLEISGGSVRPVTLFKFVALGYGLGAGVIFIPLSFVGFAFALAGRGGAWPGGENLLLAPVVVPLVIGLQALMLAALVTFGLWIYGLKRKIEAVET